MLIYIAVFNWEKLGRDWGEQERIARPPFLLSVSWAVLRLQYFSFPNRPANNRDVIVHA